jgi:hypothetical protein
VTYDDQQSFTYAISFTRGAQAYRIARQGAGRIVASNTTGQAGSAVTSTSSVDMAAGTGSITVTLTAPYSAAATASGSTHFQGLNPGDVPSDNVAHTAVFELVLTGAGPSGSATTMTWTLAYQVDSANFNPQLVDATQQALIHYRGEVVADWQAEWYNDSGYTSLYTTGNSFTVAQTSAGQDFTFYLRARRIGAPSWTNYGAVTFTDPRF